MARDRMRLGVGAQCRVLLSRLHPGDVISRAYTNQTKGQFAAGLIVTSKGTRSIRQKETPNVIIFRHEPTISQHEPFECWARERFVRVDLEGLVGDLFVAEPQDPLDGVQGYPSSPPNLTINETLGDEDPQSLRCP